MIKIICHKFLLIIFIMMASISFLYAEDTYYLKPSGEEVKAATDNFLSSNINFIDGYIVQVSFIINKNNKIQDINIASIPEESYYNYDKNGYYEIHTYGDRQKAFGTKEGYINVKIGEEEKNVPIKELKDGKSITSLYNTVKELEQNLPNINWQEHDENMSCTGTYFGKTLNIWSVSVSLHSFNGKVSKDKVYDESVSIKEEWIDYYSNNGILDKSSSYKY